MQENEQAQAASVDPIVMRRYRQTIWSIKPITGFKVGDILLPMVEFPLACRMVRVRRKGEYHPCGVIEGDGAAILQTRFVTPLPEMIVKHVSDLSGYAKARLLMYETTASA